MPFHRLLQMYLKTRIKSWLDNDEQSVWLSLTDLRQVTLATFYNGRLVRPVTAPADASGLGMPGSPDGPPPVQS